MFEFSERVLNLTILAGPKPQNFLCQSTMMADIFKHFLCPLSKKVLATPLQELFPF